MQGVRVVIAVLAAASALAVGAVVAFAAPTALSPQKGAAQAEYCPAQVKAQRATALRRFKQQMAGQRKKYFRTHRKLKQRQTFVKKQQAQLRGLQRSLDRCE